jgi:hypothetical protein
MNDKEFLQWVYNRMKYVYKENENFDFMRQMKRIAYGDNKPVDKKITPNEESKCPKCGADVFVVSLGVYCKNNCGWEVVV